VSHYRIGERPWQSSSQPTPIVTFCSVKKVVRKLIQEHTNIKHEINLYIIGE